jgi:ankyrin repeat protein
VHVAAEKGRLRVVEFFIGKGVNVNGVADGRTPLLRAAEAGRLMVCKALIETKAEVKASSFSRALMAKRDALAGLLLGHFQYPDQGTVPVDQIAESQSHAIPGDFRSVPTCGDTEAEEPLRVVAQVPPFSGDQNGMAVCLAQG